MKDSFFFLKQNLYLPFGFLYFATFNGILLKFEIQNYMYMCILKHFKGSQVFMIFFIKFGSCFNSS